MKRPDYAWELTAYRANIRNELQCVYGAFGNCNVTNADRTIHQGIEAGAGAAIFRGIFNNGPAPDKLWLNVAYTFNDFRFDNDPTFGNNLLPGAPRHYLRPEPLYRIRLDAISAPCRMGAWNPILSTAPTRGGPQPMRCGIEDGLRQWRSDFRLYRGAQSPEQGLYREHQHHQSGDRHLTLVRTGQRTGCLCRDQVSMVRRSVSGQSLDRLVEHAVVVSRSRSQPCCSELSGGPAPAPTTATASSASSHRGSDRRTSRSRRDVPGCSMSLCSFNGRRTAPDGEGPFQ